MNNEQTAKNIKGYGILGNNIFNLSKIGGSINLPKWVYWLCLISIVSFGLSITCFFICINPHITWSIETASLTIILAFVGILATIVVISNFSQVNRIEENVKENVHQINKIVKDVKDRLVRVENNIAETRAKIDEIKVRDSIIDVKEQVKNTENDIRESNKTIFEVLSDLRKTQEDLFNQIRAPYDKASELIKPITFRNKSKKQ